MVTRMAATVLTIIVGSTRPGRVGLGVAHWPAAGAGAHGAFAPLAQLRGA